MMQSHHISFMHLCCSRQQPEHRLPTGTPGCLRHQASVLSHYQKGGWNRWKCSAHTTVCLNAAVCKLNLSAAYHFSFFPSLLCRDSWSMCYLRLNEHLKINTMNTQVYLVSSLPSKWQLSHS